MNEKGVLHHLPPPPQGKNGWPWHTDIPKFPATLADGTPWPRITVVTPSYNQVDFIEQTIRSVLSQGYPNLEYMICDGASSDGSVEIIKKYESHLTYWTSEPDRGQSHAINKGFERSTGQILCWLNSDDYHLPGTLRTVAENLADASGAFAIVGHSMFVGTDGTPLMRAKGEYRNRRSLLKFWHGYNMPQPSIFWRRPVFERVGLLDESLYYTMDFDYWARITEHFDFRNINHVLSCATYHSNCKTGDNYEGFFRELRKNAFRYWGSPLGLEYWHLLASRVKHAVLPLPDFGKKVLRATNEIMSVIPEGQTFVLVDDDELGTEQVIAGRTRIPFLEWKGQYWGPPADDDIAIRELERMRQAGASFIVFAWPAFWWLEYYRGLSQHLRCTCARVLKNKRLVIFRLDG